MSSLLSQLSLSSILCHLSSSILFYVEQWWKLCSSFIFDQEQLNKRLRHVILTQKLNTLDLKIQMSYHLYITQGSYFYPM